MDKGQIVFVEYPGLSIITPALHLLTVWISPMFWAWTPPIQYSARHGVDVQDGALSQFQPQAAEGAVVPSARSYRQAPPVYYRGTVFTGAHISVFSTVGHCAVCGGSSQLLCGENCVMDADWSAPVEVDKAPRRLQSTRSVQFFAMMS